MADQIPTAKMVNTPAKTNRLAHIDWMRGLACVLMFQTHCYDSWLSPEARKSALFAWSQLGGTLPAPLFIFLSGISLALVTEKLREKNAPRGEIARTTIKRGAEIYGMGLLFRVQEFALGYPWSPWTDLLRVDVLNILGLSMMLMGILCWVTGGQGTDNQKGLPAGPQHAAPLQRDSDATRRLRNRRIIGGLLAAATVALATPPLWTTYRPRFLPWPLESYINGVHIFDKPQPWLFPLFPWAGFAFAGLAVGFFLFSEIAKRKQDFEFVALGGTGILAGVISILFDRSPIKVYAVYDYWYSGPNFFLMRCGILLVILFFVYAWCRWGFAQKGFSPIIQLGNTSLMIYWVHIEFVYGRLSILPKRQCSVLRASAGLLTIFLAMLALSLIRTNWKRKLEKGK